MIEERTLEEFRSSGLLWFVNRMLHVFGWALVVVSESDGTLVRMYPARVNFRGFTQELEDEGIKKLTDYLVENISKIQADIR